jgi:hypothetical protein
LHNEGLVDQRHFLKWILDRLATSGLEQTVVLLPLVLALLDDIIRSRALSRILINALLEKLQTVNYLFVYMYLPIIFIYK